MTAEKKATTRQESGPLPTVFIPSHKGCGRRRDETDLSHTLFVIPLRDVVVLVLGEEVTAVLSGEDAVNLRAGVRTVSNCDAKGRAGYSGGLRTVFLEERELLGELKRLAKKAPDYITDFEAGDLDIDDQNSYALRLFIVAERLMMHAKARDRVANS